MGSELNNGGTKKGKKKQHAKHEDSCTCNLQLAIPNETHEKAYSPKKHRPSQRSNCVSHKKLSSQNNVPWKTTNTQTFKNEEGDIYQNTILISRQMFTKAKQNYPLPDLQELAY